MKYRGDSRNVNEETIMVTRQSEIEQGPTKRTKKRCERKWKILEVYKKEGGIHPGKVEFKSVSIQHMLVGPFHPHSKVRIASEPNKGICDAITISEDSYITSETSLDFFHQL